MQADQAKQSPVSDTAFCLSCRKRLTRCGSSAWDSPLAAVSFDGGWSFGSRIYDAAVPGADGLGVYVTVVVCDECVKGAVAAGLAIERKSSRYLFGAAGQPAKDQKEGVPELAPR